jgi:hypothetical protein
MKAGRKTAPITFATSVTNPEPLDRILGGRDYLRRHRNCWCQSDAFGRSSFVPRIYRSKLLACRSIFIYIFSPAPPPPFTTASARPRALLREELFVEMPFLGAHSVGVGVMVSRSPCHLACSWVKASRRRSSPASRPPFDDVRRRLSHCPL